jgi:hypothetical protein
MAQDPAFLFYYKDFDNDTADWESNAIGWYIRLLIFQAGNGYIPQDEESIAQVARVKYSEFETFKKIWALRLASKFESLSEGKLYNKKLAKVQAERKSGAIKKSVLAVFGNFIKATKLSITEERELKKAFNKGVAFYGIPDNEKRKRSIYDFLNNFLSQLNKNTSSVSLSDTHILRTQHGDANEDVNIDIEKEEGSGEEKTAYQILKEDSPSWIETFEMNNRRLIPNWEIFKANFEYAVEKEEITDNPKLMKKRLQKLLANWDKSPKKNSSELKTEMNEKVIQKISKYDD